MAMSRMSTIPMEPTTLDVVEGDAADLYEAVAQAVEHDPPSDRDRGFGADALKVSRKIFAMLVDGNLVLKLPRPGRGSLEAGDGAPFDPGHGRVMRGVGHGLAGRRGSMDPAGRRGAGLRGLALM